MENKKFNDPKDCPLCGEKKCIPRSEYKEEFKPRPASKGTIGNYTISHSGGEYNYSHAETCPNLKQVFDKVGLLSFYVEGDSNLRSDFKSFDHYQTELNKLGFKILTKLERQDDLWAKFKVNKTNSQKKEWVTVMSIRKVTKQPEEYLVTKAKDPDTAFNHLRHKIICGEVFGYKAMDGLFQFYYDKDGKIDLFTTI
ncbi:MAG: hypothetical protein QG594_1541 [Bacteroidota bacterium]|jgi:hypothetical protein|nr:hypothetical protein [Bacteroidota bacterium]